MDILELFPQFVLYAFAALLAVFGFAAFWMAWRYFSPAAPGEILGYYRIFGRYAGGKMYEEISGRLVDATSIFINPQDMVRFKRIVIRNAEEKLQKDNPPLTEKERSQLKEDIEEFRKYPSSKLFDFCRVIVTRERFSAKHIFIQWKKLKPIGEYAATRAEHRFSFGFGPEKDAVISGDMYTLPEPWRLRIGKCQVHIFVPDAEEKETEWESPPESLVRLLLFAAPAVEADALLENMRGQLKQKDDVIADMQEKYSASSSLADHLYSILKGVMPEIGEVDLESLKSARSLEVVDFVLIAVSTLASNYLAQYFKFEPLAGSLLGLAVGFFLAYYRRLKR